jgi:large subunit ribosomal protein L15
MVGLNELRPAPGSRRKPKRVGRGHGSGLGKTSGRGHKGQGARSGKGKPRRGFEGGQMPLARRLPKRGFKNLFSVKYNIVNVQDLNRFEAGATVGEDELKNAGMLKRKGWPVKILGKGELDRSVTVRAHRFSASARKKIEEAGGKAEDI